MPGSDEKEKEESDNCTKSTEILNVDVLKPTPREVQGNTKLTNADPPLKETFDNIQRHKGVPQQKQESTEIHLVQHLMKMKTNPTIKNLTKFVNRLDRVVATINNLEGVKIMYKLSDEMSEKVKNNMQELEFLSLEMKATLNNLHRLKKKRTILRKEKEVIKETRINTKREEVHEMETIIAIYDKDLLRNWHVVKKSSSVQSIENFITHLKGKKQAMEFVFQLATEKLICLKNKLGRQPKTDPKTIIKALPPPSSGSDQDSIISTD
ncbi:uncharacterized protein isoform X2 [Rhodnius prolixus]|uniref:uncharacterized protein isoform X2 n=1 Tax=Rhodnius prolixus TaxID=13249 RepID=UPI003D18E748